MKKVITLALLLTGLIAVGQVEVPENPLLQNNIQLRIDPNIVFESTEAPGPPVELPVEVPPDPNLKRLIFLVHGLGGDGSSWSRVNEALELPMYNVPGFQARKCIALRPDYNNSSNTLNLAALDVADYITTKASIYNNPNNPSYTPDKNRNFIIGHSQGGMVARTLLYQDFVSPGGLPDGYGGLVTVASPLQGAMILNNKQQIYNMAYDACKALTAGPVAEFQNPPFIAPLVNMFIGNFGEQIADKSCNFVSFALMPELYKDMSTGTTNDYKVGSPFINTLNSSTASADYLQMPKLAFYGVEPTDGLLWRTANWFTSNPNTPLHWQANDDDALYSSVKSKLFQVYAKGFFKYKNKEKIAKDNYYLCLYSIILAPFALIHKAEMDRCREIASGYKKGIDWIFSADNQWKTIIGHYGLVANAPSYYCYYKDGIKLHSIHVNDPTLCPPSLPNSNNYIPLLNVVGPVTTFSTVEKESDGVALAESANNLPGATYFPVKIRGKLLPDNTYSGSSHMQIRNDEGMKGALNKLLNGDFGLYFKTIAQ